ncbi:MAG TPA: hypothetical protein PLW24_00800 [Burkholderiaceae bacterium]|nr:hypothetical protein [Burkholderiaceae bacterium]HNG77976.1 hypothetical protein [Burkholderiaceae bacterium]
MNKNQLRTKITDDTLRDLASALSARLRGQKGADRQETLHDIAALIRTRRILSEAKRPDTAKSRQRDWREERER